MKTKTIIETSEELRKSLRDYIEATYHISNSMLVEQRKELLDRPGIIYQRPYLESTPSYKLGKKFADLGLPDAVVDIFSQVTMPIESLPVLIHDPPYQHQALAVKQSIVDKKSLVVMTGTGSGKTECFLLPILGKLAIEAHAKGPSFGGTPAVRALVLYPMNALVNDQLGRLRLLFGDSRIVNKFVELTGRPARFARYTSRTLYPGVRDIKKDQLRLSSIEKYYIRYIELANDMSSPDQETAANLIKELKQRGKWPAKSDLLAWYGRKGSRWRDSQTGEFSRCVALQNDPELFTRHEVQASPPDILVTNYSMLEYMLMRPIERPIFDYTRKWLKENPNEHFLLVLDEAHLYRGAAGAEVALLIRRLRTRLEIPPERLQIICTSASFQDADYAMDFGAQLTGKQKNDFNVIEGELFLRNDAKTGNSADAEALSCLRLQDFYEADSEAEKLNIVGSFLKYRSIDQPQGLESSLFKALNNFPPMGLLINLTMTEAQPLGEIASQIFPKVEASKAERAMTALLALGSLARKDKDAPGLLPCRIHSFFRGLPGLWACMDPNCTELVPAQQGGPCGKLYSQPRQACDCGARVLELYTCRSCGSAYARAYTDEISEPDYLWPEAGSSFHTRSENLEELRSLDLLLEKPNFSVEPADFDLITGRLNPEALGKRVRSVFLKSDRTQDHDDEGNVIQVGGEFLKCGVCGERRYNRPLPQDHKTKGDQPFQALITKQLEIQPPSRPATSIAPLRGRKVLVFSDSRQVAARLAPNIQKYSTQDALRPLIVAGFNRLKQSQMISPTLSLEDLYPAVLIASKELGVRLRPELKEGESFHAEDIVSRIEKGKTLDEVQLLDLLTELRTEPPPEALLKAIINSFGNKHYGLESLALATIVERQSQIADLLQLPNISNIAETDDQKIAMVRFWLNCWQRMAGFWLSRMPSGWWLNDVKPHSGSFEAVKRFLENKEAKKVFKSTWLPTLSNIFTEPVAAGKYKLKGSKLSLLIGGDWAYCQSCRTTQRPYPGTDRCINCGQNTATVIDPNSDTVFATRKSYYRAATIAALSDPSTPIMSIIAAEHTAQLNAAQANEVFSKAEESEILFQDIDMGLDEKGHEHPAVDVLSCTTTMEVGIDIGSLTGVSLRNMPPARANYQQRAGRAGRRGNAVATVTAFGSADNSHDEHNFLFPDQMIRGAVDDPRLTLDNREIARRHVTAYLLQKYHQFKLPHIEPEDQPQLFAVLGSVGDFKKTDTILNRSDFSAWLTDNETELRNEVKTWLPKELSSDETSALLDSLVEETLLPIDAAIGYKSLSNDSNTGDEDETEEEQRIGEDETALETADEEGEELPGMDIASDNFLDRLLYKGVLPRYAFPTDVATFHVFNPTESTYYRPLFRYTPSQGLPVALSQYAPGKDVWIGNKLWTSGAIYSPFPDDRYNAWRQRRLYYECNNCGYALTLKLGEGTRDEIRDCEACGTPASFGPARYWLRPPGFAHPVDKEPETSPDDQPPRSYATRAKLTATTPSEKDKVSLNNQIQICHMRQHLLMTNRGPRREGYTYCTICGRIEPTSLPKSSIAGVHNKPYPDEHHGSCEGGGTTRGMVLGTDFITDVLLITLKVEPPITITPGVFGTDIALRTLSEALTKAACATLGLEVRELQAEYRPALTSAGRLGLEAEIYMYDTLPGGAGFVRRVGELGLSVFESALEILENCPEKCDSSCYRCLRNYNNLMEHDWLDRKVAASLLKFLLTGSFPAIDISRLSSSTDMLFEDLSRQDFKTFNVERNKEINLPGFKPLTVPIYLCDSGGRDFAVGLHGPLSPDDCQDAALCELKEYSATMPVLLIDELVVRRNLPAATNRIISELGIK